MLRNFKASLDFLMTPALSDFKWTIKVRSMSGQDGGSRLLMDPTATGTIKLVSW